MLDPKVIVADEAVSALDVSIKAQVCNLLLVLQQSLNLAYLFISHDMAVVERVSHRVAVMYLGEIVEIGRVRRCLKIRSILHEEAYGGGAGAGPGPAQHQAQPFTMRSKVPFALSIMSRPFGSTAKYGGSFVQMCGSLDWTIERRLRKGRLFASDYVSHLTCCL